MKPSKFTETVTVSLEASGSFRPHRFNQTHVKKVPATRALTYAGQELTEPLFREQRVFQAAEVELQNSSHRVDVVIALVVSQGVVSWKNTQDKAD